MALVTIRYWDIGRTRPRYGCGSFRQERVIRDIERVEGGETGLITYQRRPVRVYRRTDASGWETNPDALKPPKAAYLHRPL